jgi:ATP-dependent exoDNAse (exonuclease V) beta subunit
MELEVMLKKNIRESMMKRNKRTEIMGHEDLNPLTEQVLAQMGPEGADIRKRLKTFYRQRANKNPPPLEEHLKETA